MFNEIKTEVYKSMKDVDVKRECPKCSGIMLMSQSFLKEDGLYLTYECVDALCKLKIEVKVEIKKEDGNDTEN